LEHSFAAILSSPGDNADTRGNTPSRKRYAEGLRFQAVSGPRHTLSVSFRQDNPSSPDLGKPLAKSCSADHHSKAYSLRLIELRWPGVLFFTKTLAVENGCRSFAQSLYCLSHGWIAAPHLLRYFCS